MKQGATAAEVAFDVARRFAEFGSYGQSRARAVRALRRRAPEVCKASAEAAFDRSLLLLNEAKELVDRSLPMLWEGWDAKSMTLDEGSVASELSSKFPDLPKATCSAAVQWIFYWHHLR